MTAKGKEEPIFYYFVSSDQFSPVSERAVRLSTVFFYFRGKYAAVVDCTDIPGAYLVLSYDFVVATGSRSAGQASWLADKFIVRWAASFC